MMSLPVWVPGPMFLLRGISGPDPMFLLGCLCLEGGSVKGVSVNWGL